MPFTQLPGVVGAYQALQENQLTMEGQKADLQTLALKQEDAQLTLQQKKIDLANQEAFRQTVLSKLSAGEQDRDQLATLSNQPTEYQKLHSNLEDLHGRMQNHVSLVQATQAAIQEYAHKDPLYAQKMQEELNSQIKAGFDLNKEQFELQSKEAEKISNELYPVLNDGEKGKFSPSLYRQWYEDRIKEGVPLADMGLTGNPSLDQDQLKLIFSHGVKASDQINADYKQVQEKQRQWENTLRERTLAEKISDDRQKNALGRERLDISRARMRATEARVASLAKDPIIAQNKEQNANYRAFRKDYDPLKKAFDKETDPEVKAAYAEDLKTMVDNFEEQKKITMASYHLVPKESQPAKTPAKASAKAAAPSTAAEFWNQ